MNVLITGGSKGLGAAIVQRLAANSQNIVFFTYNASQQQAEQLETEFKNCKKLKCNLTSEAELEKLLTEISTLQIDVLINNFSVGYEQNHFHKMKATEFRTKFEANVMPTVQLTQALIKEFRNKKFGRIITILSHYITGVPPIGLSEYVAEKNYLHSLSNSWATEYARYNITSNCISPSFLKTDFNATVDERLIETLAENNPQKKLLTPEEVAHVAEFLMQVSPHFNGQNIVLI